ncbi:LCP family protein required for cell wall assembly [Hamadaea flava]|uniref:LCP family protein n=1 Tax=Hamadaea flava TaxID=1742688 RepID=A0ABV8LKK5_9ACTN|nr:LCP family protein [Hamadaea flava]MCP2325026.1 LCP family protein required for cell wall assembly [Hamadaea flava]
MAARKVRSPLGARIVAVLGVLLALAGFGGIVAAKSFLNDLTSSIEVADVDGHGGANGRPMSGAINLLLLGLDTREGWAENTSRADTIMLLHVSASHDEAYLMSIPRDTKVDIPAWANSGYAGGRDKINAAYFFGSQQGQGWPGGAGLMKQTVEQLTGISFNGLAVIDFNGFKNVIAALGGVYLCVEHDTWSSHYIEQNGKPVYYSYDGQEQLPNSWIHKKGCRTMAAWEALDYSRQRYGLPNGDYDRQKHQRELIKAMGAKATSAGVLTNPAKLAELLKAAGASLKLDTGGYDPADFLFNLKVLAAADLVTLKTNAGSFNEDPAGGEALSAGTMRMFEAARDDTLGTFLADNPEYLSP